VADDAVSQDVEQNLNKGKEKSSLNAGKEKSSLKWRGATSSHKWGGATSNTAVQRLTRRLSR
jgi:hypothetical protein